MSNPFADAAGDLVVRLRQVTAEEQAAEDAAAADRLAKERSFERAAALFAAVQARVDDCVRQANEAFGDAGPVLSTKVEPIKPSNAGCITVACDGIGKQAPSFRVVGNASFKVFVHELKDPKFGPFDLEDAAALPYEEMFNQFIRSVTQGLASRATGKPTA